MTKLLESTRAAILSMPTWLRILMAVYFLFHLGFIVFMVPNVPHWDEWDSHISFAYDLKHSKGLAEVFALFIAPDDQHRIILPKILYSTAQYLPGQVKWLMALTLILMLGLFIFLWQNYFRQKLDLKKDKFFIAGLFLFCLSWGQSDVYIMGICISWVISNFCFILALRSMQKHQYAQMSVYMLINVLTLGTWLLSVPIILLAFAQEFFSARDINAKGTDAKGTDAKDKGGRKRLAIGAFAFGVVSVLLYVFYLPHTPVVGNTTFALWRYLGHLMMFWGIPFASPGHKVAFFFGIVFFALIIWYFSSRKRLAKLQEPLIVLYGVTSGILISKPRSPTWEMFEAIGNRYSIVMTLSWSFILLSLWLAFAKFPNARKALLAAMFILMFITSGNELVHEIRSMKRRELAGACIERILASPSLNSGSSLNPSPSSQKIRELSPADEACLKVVYPDPQRVLELAEKTKMKF